MKPGSDSLKWRRLLACALVLAACSGSANEQAVDVQPVSGLCPPIGYGGGAGWATTCDGGTVVNVDTGEKQQLRCQPATARAEVQAIISVRSDAVVLFSCRGDLDDPTTTMVQSLVAHSGMSPVDMGFPAFEIYAAAYSTAGGGSIVMVSGTCHGLLVYRLDSSDSLTGETSPVSKISLGGDEFELDGGREFGDAPPCTELAAVRGLGSSADGSTLALALVGPDQAMAVDRTADVFAGSVDLEESEGGLTLTGDVKKMADNLDELTFAIGVADCNGHPKLVVGGGGRPSVLAADKVTALELRPAMEWGGVAVSDDGQSLLVVTDMPFEPGDVYRTDSLGLC